MNTITIDSRFSLLPGELAPRTDAEIKSEPMLFNCDLESAHRHGNQMTREFLANLPDDWRCAPLVLDSRVHMLMPGWYPCIPGWHHDDVPRTRSDGQPNYGAGQVRSAHIIALVNGDICPTEFALGAANLAEPALGRVVYADWHEQVELLTRNGVLEVQAAPSNRLVSFDDRTWHRGTAAVAGGWRFFIRASRYFDAATGRPVERHNKRTNEVRRQAQVYMSAVNAGW